MLRFGIEWSPDGVVTHVLEESSPLPQPTDGGDNSRWEPELDNGTKGAVIADGLLDMPWKTFPMWRVGIELRRILVKSDFNISILTRLASEFNEDIERSEVPRDLLPLPLPKMSDEQEVDKAIRDFEDMDFVASGTSFKTWWWLGTESWMMVILALLNFLHTGKDPRYSDLGIGIGELNESQKVAYMRLYSQVQLCIDVVPPTDFLDKDHSWDRCFLAWISTTVDKKSIQLR